MITQVGHEVFSRRRVHVLIVYQSQAEQVTFLTYCTNNEGHEDCNFLTTDGIRVQGVELGAEVTATTRLKPMPIYINPHVNIRRVLHDRALV